MLKKRKLKLRAYPDVSALAAVLLVLLVVYMILFLPNATSEVWAHWWSKLPSYKHSVAVPRANREDAMIVVITVDGKIFFNCTLGNTCQVALPGDLPSRIQAELRQGAQKRIYIKADPRTKYGYVKEVLDAVRAVGIQDVSFITGFESGPFTPTSD